MKTAVVLFADTPLLEQAGLSLKNDFSATARLRLYSDYINDSISYFKNQQIDFWLTCEEVFQETLLEQHFPEVTGCRIVSGGMEKKLTTLTDYFLNLKEYKYVTFLFQPFSFFWPELKTQVEQAFRRTARSVVLLTADDSFALHGLTVSFPFSKLFEDIVWEKNDRYKQIKEHCQDVAIPCKRLKVSDMNLLPVDSISSELGKELAHHYPNFYRTLTLALNKRSN